jgi:hypothetical protein
MAVRAKNLFTGYCIGANHGADRDLREWDLTTFKEETE